MLLKRFNEEINKILNEENKLFKINSIESGYEYPDELLEDAFDNITFRKFEDLLNHKDFIDKLKNTDKQVLKDAAKGLWEDSIEQYDVDHEDIKKEATKFYFYIKELIAER